MNFNQKKNADMAATYLKLTLEMLLLATLATAEIGSAGTASDTRNLGPEGLEVSGDSKDPADLKD